jgi:ribosomal protein S18 acetylase RimI-like enzyme
VIAMHWLETFGIVFRWRAAMSLTLAELAERPALPEGYTLRPWRESDAADIVEVDFAAYAGTVDGWLYHSYFRSPEGCRRLLGEALAGRFGRLEAEKSFVLCREGEVVGDCLAFHRNSREGFIGNLAVAPAHRGGTGRALLLSSLWAFKDAGYRTVSLAVTLDNTRAVRLYQSVGFRQEYRFPVWTWAGWPSRGVKSWH